MKKAEVLNRYSLNKLGDDTVFIQGASFNFAYTIADSIVKDEFVGKYRYFGGLQCDYSETSENYKNLEKWLCEIAECTLK